MGEEKNAVLREHLVPQAIVDTLTERNFPVHGNFPVHLARLLAEITGPHSIEYDLDKRCLKVLQDERDWIFSIPTHFRNLLNYTKQAILLQLDINSIKKKGWLTIAAEQ